MRDTLTVVGSVNVDLVARVPELPAPGVTVGGGVLSRHPGGKGANQAVAAARLGGTVRFVGAVGADDEGRDLLGRMAAVGVDVSKVRTVADPTGTALIMVEESGENQIAVCPGANARVDLTEMEFGPGEAVLTQLEIDMRVVLDLAERARGFFALNASPATTLPEELLARADLVIVNRSEYEAMPSLRRGRLVAVTFGARGAALLDHGAEVARAASPRVSAVNSVGAGDAFTAALVLALRRGLPHDRALAAACAVGAAAVQDPSSQPPLKPLDDYVRDRPGPC
ncbi:ribokinase [Sphaerisporangium siamense]|uniref:Ribokinase n=1 Tax=Sphaerisporangium siamense TaxID=795645 RepID=A0A7W7G6J4_9ACTN|nr:ribokinase [Sphaerisporangium siamense]MBB4699593.1 ribokinase [Sphaerisporangium siamense]GII87007.1 ribokinase [Sphaerisporangium siamense]